MELKNILAHTDSTILSACATWTEVKQVLEDAWQMRCASACIPPAHVHKAADYMEGCIRIGTVIGYPYGYSTTRTKCYETAEAVTDGADEVDLFINPGWVKSGDWESVLREIREVRKAADTVRGGVILKVVAESRLFTDEEKIRLCGIVSGSGADYIGISAGLLEGNTVADDIALIKNHLTNGVKIKVSGETASIEDAERFLKLGADRLGMRRFAGSVKEEQSGAGDGSFSDETER